MVPSVLRAASAFALALAAATAVGTASASAQFCESWRDGREIRCLGHRPVVEVTAGLLGDKAALAPLGTVTLTNRHFDGPVTYKRQAWVSVCNVSGAPAPAVEETLAPGHARRFALLLDDVADRGEVPPPTTVAPLGGGLGFDTIVTPHVCLEVFFFDCRVGGRDVKCLDGLEAGAEPPAAP